MFTAEIAYEQQLKTTGEQKVINRITNAANNGAIADAMQLSIINQLILTVAQGIEDAAPEYFSKTKIALPDEVKQYMITQDFLGTSPKGEAVVEKYIVKCTNLAAIAVRALFNAAFAAKDKHSTVNYLAVQVGQQVEQNYRFNSFKLQNEHLFNKVVDTNLKDPLFSLDSAIKNMEKFLVDTKGLTPGLDWGLDSDVVYAHIGQWLIQQVLDNPNSLFAVDKKVIKMHPESIIVPTEALVAAVDQAMIAEINSAMVKAPMLEAPNQWSVAGNDGGYSLNGTALNMPIMLHKTGQKIGQPSQTSVDLINTVQEVAWKINGQIVAIANALADQQISLGKFVVVSDSMNAVQKAKATKLSIAPLANLEHANTLLTQEAMFMPHCMDWRGRVYPYNSLLNSQSTDFGKSLLMFAMGSPVTQQAKKWLAIQVANTFGNGKDKLPTDHKLAWVKGQHKLIAKVAKDPTAYAVAMASGTVECAGEPWQFLAACMEYNACVIGDQKLTYLPVASDATCSGVQILSGLMLDAQAAQQVNVLPSTNGVAADLYTACAQVAPKFVEHVNGSIKQEKNQLTPNKLKAVTKALTGKYARKLAKPVVMTSPYNATAQTQTDEVLAVAEELGIELSYMQAYVLVASVRKALFEELAPAMKVMEVLGKLTKGMIQLTGSKSVTWTSPSGVVVTQTKQQSASSRVHVAGKKLVIKTFLPTTNPDGHESAIAPNLVHSLDSALLHNAFAQCEVPFGLIHDSVLAPATYMDEMITKLKEEYIAMFSQDVLGKFLQETGLKAFMEECKVPPSVIEPIGTLDLSKVMDSEYFFS